MNLFPLFIYNKEMRNSHCILATHNRIIMIFVLIIVIIIILIIKVIRPKSYFQQVSLVNFWSHVVGASLITNTYTSKRLFFVYSVRIVCISNMTVFRKLSGIICLSCRYLFSLFPPLFHSVNADTKAFSVTLAHALHLNYFS